MILIFIILFLFIGCFAQTKIIRPTNENYKFVLINHPILINHPKGIILLNVDNNGKVKNKSIIKNIKYKNIEKLNLESLKEEDFNKIKYYIWDSAIFSINIINRK